MRIQVLNWSTPDKEGQMYHVVNDDLYLIPTAEVPITNVYRGNLIAHEDLPIKHMGTPCFRRGQAHMEKM